jgi:hypothetical protein
MHHTPGKQNIRYALRGNNDQTLAGGIWQSFPRKGMCLPWQTFGNSKCTWKLDQVSKAINASCLYEVTDRMVAGWNPTCFEKCP